MTNPRDELRSDTMGLGVQIPESVRVRTTQDYLMSLCQLAEEQLAEMRRIAHRTDNGVTDSVSSVAIEDLAKGDPKITTKLYPTSPLTTEHVDHALAMHAYAHRRAAEMAMNGWAETVEQLQNGGAK